MAPPPAKKEKKGVKKLWKKIKDKLKGRASNTATEPTATGPIVPATPTPAVAASSSTPTPAPVVQKPEPPVATTTEQISPLVIEVDDNREEPSILAEPVEKPRPLVTSADETSQSNESQMRFAKAQAIFAKYNLELSESDWDHRPKVPYERVTKKIRMRVRYTCHNCSTSFGHDRVCTSCEHRRCAKCSRYPPKKPKDKTSKGAAAGPGETTKDASNPKPDSSCHECQTRFVLGDEECPNCHHKICERCLQEASITLEDVPGSSGGQRLEGDKSTAVS